MTQIKKDANALFPINYPGVYCLIGGSLALKLTEVNVAWKPEASCQVPQDLRRH